VRNGGAFARILVVGHDIQIHPLAINSSHHGTTSENETQPASESSSAPILLPMEIVYHIYQST